MWLEDFKIVSYSNMKILPLGIKRLVPHVSLKNRRRMFKVLKYFGFKNEFSVLCSIKIDRVPCCFASLVIHERRWNFEITDLVLKASCEDLIAFCWFPYTVMDDEGGSDVWYGINIAFKGDDVKITIGGQEQETFVVEREIPLKKTFDEKIYLFPNKIIEEKNDV